ncbi:hypothetical protein ACLK2F_16820 [Escherichia coli]
MVGRESELFRYTVKYSPDFCQRYRHYHPAAGVWFTGTLIKKSIKPDDR